MSNLEISKKCPSCHQIDRTDWAKCRNCGTKYNAVITEPADTPAFSDGTKLGFLFFAIIIGAGIFAIKYSQTARIKSIKTSVQAANRPRLMEFYSNSSSSSQTYVPVLSNCAKKYGDKVDFQILDVDNPANIPLVRMFNIDRLPTTCLFDRRGRETKSIAGAISTKDLDKYMKAISSQL